MYSCFPLNPTYRVALQHIVGLCMLKEIRTLATFVFHNCTEVTDCVDL